MIFEVMENRDIRIACKLSTFSGVLLRPSARKADTDLPAEDLWLYQEQGKKGTEFTGYPNISIFQFFIHPIRTAIEDLLWMIFEVMEN
ncbi:MAG: hypothetical protein AAFV93_20285, partial [Chloroflexota bacterium]